MFISHIALSNWRNFKHVDVPLKERLFIIGPNACGKSNFLDAFRFLRDVARSGGGLQEAVRIRGGVSRIRCLSARAKPDIGIEVVLSNEDTGRQCWKYQLVFSQSGGGVVDVAAKVKKETIWSANGMVVHERPDSKDRDDDRLVQYTHLEQPTANASFRDIADFLTGIQYLHIVPQLVRDSQSFVKTANKEDFYGRDFLERVKKTGERVRQSHLRKIEKALASAVPHFERLTMEDDDMGVPHLQMTYRHWRPGGARQREDQFSDGTLRMIGLLWSLLDGSKPLLLEEPELSLNREIVGKLGAIIYRMQKQKQRQVIVSTHSGDLLSDPGIGAEEVLLMTPGTEGTEVRPASSYDEIRRFLEAGMSIGEAALPFTRPENVNQLDLFQ